MEDSQRDGRTIKGLIGVSRSGYIWDLERTSGKINTPLWRAREDSNF
jgi:hypothetical protein